MSKKSEVITARRAALGLTVITNDIVINSAPTSMIKSVSPSGITEITSAPARSRALVTTTAAPLTPAQTTCAQAPQNSNAIDTSIAYANHCNDGERLTASDIEKGSSGKSVHAAAPAPRSALERANGRLSLVPMSGHSAAS